MCAKKAPSIIFICPTENNFNNNKELSPLVCPLQIGTVVAHALLIKLIPPRKYFLNSAQLDL